MLKHIAIGIVLFCLPIGKAHSANDKEYLEFIESNGVVVLETYRLPKGEDLTYWGTDRNTFFYKTKDSDLDHKAPYWTKGYFNDDSLPDYIYILFHRTQNEGFVIGFISSESGYRSVAIESSYKNMAIATRDKQLGHFHMEGHGHGLIWDNREENFVVIE
ncbi:MAG: hypothetical protein DRR06_17300 [Gammaproteobacteria bacterium]|nr:MAG: hypothetical protein DRR06_17300 [Gammaproteobacteria bacterium]